MYLPPLKEIANLFLQFPHFWIGDLAELAQIPRLVSLRAATESRLFHLPSRAISTLLEHAANWPSFYRLNALDMHRVIMVAAEALDKTSLPIFSGSGGRRWPDALPT